MKKLIFGIILIAICQAILFSSCSNVTNNDEDSTELSSEVVAVIEKSPISIGTNGNVQTSAKTDKKGVITVEHDDGSFVEQYVWQDDTELSHSISTYNDSGLCITKEVISADKQTNTVYSYEYDSENNIISQKESVLINGNISKTTVSDANGNVSEYSIYSFNDNSQLTKIETYNSDDILIKNEEYTYDSENRLLTYTLKNSDGTDNKKTVNEYSDNQTISYNYENDNLTQYIVYENDSSGDPISSTVYDAQGNVISQDVYQTE